MAVEASTSNKGKLVIKNIGLLLSGDINNPILDADTIVSVDGKIAAIGKEKDCDTSGATTLIDAKGTTLAPGLIDSTCIRCSAIGRRGRTNSAGSNRH